MTLDVGFHFTHNTVDMIICCEQGSTWKQLMISYREHA